MGHLRTFCDTTRKVCFWGQSKLVMVALQNEQLPLAPVDSDGGIQKFFDFVKALVGCCLFHEHVHYGVPPEVFNKALDGQDVMGAV